MRRLRAMREQIKSFRQLVKAGETDKAAESMNGLYKSIDKAAKRGVIKSNNASRKKSRLAQSLKKAQS